MPFWRYIFLVEPDDHAARLGLVRTLAEVRLVHHDRVVQKLLVDARSEIGGLDVVRPHFLSFAIVDGELGHVVYSCVWTGRLSDQSVVRLSSSLFLLLVCYFAFYFTMFVSRTDDVTAVRTGHSTADQQQVVLGVDLHELLVPHG